MFESQIQTIGERELPGMGCWNSMARFLRGFQSRNKYLILNSRPGGGCYFEIDIEAIAEFVKEYLEAQEEEEGLDPTSTDDRKAKLPARTVYLHDRRIPVHGKTVSVGASLMCVWVEIRKSSAHYQTGSEFPALVSVSDSCLRWPVCTLRLVKMPVAPDETEANPTYYVCREDRHVGDICIPTMPHFWLDGFGEGFAVRSASGAGEFYEKPEVCEQEEEEEQQ